jgi:hypothetical protein
LGFDLFSGYLFKKKFGTMDEKAVLTRWVSPSDSLKGTSENVKSKAKTKVGKKWYQSIGLALTLNR